MSERAQPIEAQLTPYEQGVVAVDRVVQAAELDPPAHSSDTPAALLLEVILEKSDGQLDAVQFQQYVRGAAYRLAEGPWATPAQAETLPGMDGPR